MLNKPKCIIFDLDGTLCELWDSANPYNHDWEEISIPEMSFIFQALSYFDDEVKIIVMTWRKRIEHYETTELWLDRNFIFPDELIMQEWSTAEKNHIYKEKELIKLQERYEIVAMFDDNPDLIPVCNKLWILLLTVHR